ncbi:hypothetical protein RJ639_005614, partial [Escallonia herrerae]
PLHSPVEGVESVVATVSGYHGSQRFKLIKLLSQAGASYVGTLNQSTTHLVCWKFEGKKYEFARKSKTAIVNHRWVEDCIKRGRRVREHPYTQLCKSNNLLKRARIGQEVGPLLLEILLVEKASLLPQNQSQACDNSKNPMIDVDSGEADCATWTVSNLLKENLFPELGRSDISYRRSKKKILRRRVKQDHLYNSRYLHDEPSEPEELGSSPYTRLRRQKRTPSTSAEASRKGRRMVRKNTSRNFLASLSDSEQECRPRQNCHPTHDITATSSSSSGGRTVCEGRNTGASTDRFSDHMATTNEALRDADNIKHLHNALAPQDRCSAVDEGLNGTEHNSRLSTSTELSCVICWTDFSSTRGILPCGHRFCFSCIQSWADHMVYIFCSINDILFSLLYSLEGNTQSICSGVFPFLSKYRLRKYAVNAVAGSLRIYSLDVNSARFDVFIHTAWILQWIHGHAFTARISKCSTISSINLLL